MIENILKRKQEFSQDPAACITGILSNKMKQFKALVTAFEGKLAGRHALATNPEWVPYQLTEYPGDVELIYVRWGLLGFFQFRFFQRYWHKLALGGYQVEIIDGYEHHQPDWMAVANIIQARFKQAGL